MGNAANSIILDTQPSFQIGVISGSYHLQEPRANSTYQGIVLETSAAVNVGMEGAPLLDKAGEFNKGIIQIESLYDNVLGHFYICDNKIPTDKWRIDYTDSGSYHNWVQADKLDLTSETFFPFSAKYVRNKAVPTRISLP